MSLLLLYYLAKELNLFYQLLEFGFVFPEINQIEVLLEVKN